MKPAPLCHVFREQAVNSKGDCYWLETLFLGLAAVLTVGPPFSLGKGIHGREELMMW